MFASKSVIKIILILFLGLITGPGDVYSRTLTIERGNNLQATIDFASDGDTILIRGRDFDAVPTDFIDSLCGNCTEHRTAVKASCGLVVRDKSLHLIGTGRGETTINTHSGYGIFFVNSPHSSLQNLTITGGHRDPDGKATDAAVVVRNAGVEIRNCDISDNTDRVDSIVVGIAGIVGREGAELLVDNCRIINNGWDGVALYRGATAIITDCLIKDGRGAGIGVTWDATCLAYRNIVAGYWKGIGAFGTAWVAARNNAVMDNLGWGIIATGKSYMDISNNVVHHNGNCGVAPWSNESRGRIINNIIIDNGWREEWVCPCVGVWNYGDWAKWEFAYNIVWNNKEGNYRDIWDQTDINGNLSVDPGFVGDSIFILKAGSRAVDAGHPEIFDNDGTCSDIGLYGGPQAKKR
nr:right-handed parallel beta-helix repeat-containing protein [candidate division Zixibacteria bacterium]